MNSTRSLCIVDDTADYRFLLQHLFKTFFPTYPVRFFPDGQTFLKAIAQMQPLPGLIVLDQHMPELDGHQTLVQLKQHPVHQTIPVILMSSTDSVPEIVDCYQAGANAFVLKPVDFESLKQTMGLICDYWMELNE